MSRSSTLRTPSTQGQANARGWLTKQLAGAALLGGMLLAGADGVRACSRVFSSAVSNGQAMVVGRTMDLFVSDNAALVMRSPGMVAGEFFGDADPNPKRWTVRYGSVGVLSLEKVLSDGLNERGLNANLLYLDGSRYGSRSSDRPGISNANMVAFVLDNFATVEEALAGLRQIQVVSDKLMNREWGLHLSLADRGGDSAVVEYIDGQMVVHRGAKTAVMTNEPPLDWQLRNLKRYKPFGGTLALPGDVDPPSRFVRGSTYLSTLPKAKSQDDAEANLYGVMKNIAVPAGAQDYSGGTSVDSWDTLWTVIVNMSAGSYAFQLAHNPYPVWVELDQLTWKPGGGMRRLDVQSPDLTGDVSQLLNRAPIQP